MYVTRNCYSAVGYSHEQMESAAQWVARHGRRVLKEAMADAFVVTGTSGVVMAGAVLALADMPMLMVRKDQDTHNHGSRYEMMGALGQGEWSTTVSRVVLLDDLIATGATFKRIAAQCRDHECELVGAMLYGDPPIGPLLTMRHSVEFGVIYRRSGN